MLDLSPFIHRLIRTLVILVAIGTAGHADEPSQVVDFQNDLIPIFTKFGCNAGTCHGAAIGRGGLKLSLYGGDPDADYDALVRQVGGRRINLAKPAQSLLLLKPTEYLAHGGGTVFDNESVAAKRVFEWVRQGAPKLAKRQLRRVEITPKRHVSPTLDTPVPVRATAHYSDGTKKDVTRWTVFTVEDQGAVRFDESANEVRVTRRGRHIIVARFLDKVVPLEFIVRLSDANVELTDEPRDSFIDEEVLKALTTLGLAPSPIIDDATFIRRITLDLTGRLPDASRVAQFSRDRSKDKRRVLIDELLKSDGFTEYWTLQLAKLLRVRPPGGDRTAARTYHDWVKGQVRGDVSYRKLVRDLILSSGDTHKNGPANFYRTTKGPREQAEFFSELLMGSRLRCANCHNHPLDRWTQDDYHGLAAVFAKVSGGQVIKRDSSRKVIHPRTLDDAAARIPGQKFLAKGSDERQQLADWLTDKKNPYFAKAIVNRLWNRLMGRGLVEPVDDFRATNPATHPELLDKLAEDFVAHEYSLRHTLRLIANSTTYARSSNATKSNRADRSFYSHVLRKPLEPEVLADAISDVLGVSERYGEVPEGTRAVSLFDPQTPSQSLDVLGRCRREASCESASSTSGGLTQKLHLFNGALLNSRIDVEGSRLHRLLKSRRKPSEVINEFYMVALGRRPNEREAKHWGKQLSSAPDKREFLQDFVWGLLTSREFTTNH